MTSPPQQPGPGAWGHRTETDQDEQQRPNWYGNQHTPWGPSQAPRPAPPAQQPGQRAGQPFPPPPPDWGGTGRDQAGREPVGLDDIELPPRRSRWPWVLGVVLVLVLTGAGVGGYFLFLDGPGPARPTARAVVDKANAGELDTLGDRLCRTNRPTIERQLELLRAGELDLRLGAVDRAGETATAEVTGLFSLDGLSHRVDQTLGLTVEDGRWKVCDLAA